MLSTFCQDDTAVDCSELVLKQNIALDLFANNCFDAEYNGRAMIVCGMGGCGKSKLIANINSVIRSCGKQALLVSTTGYTSNQIGGRKIHSVLCLPLKYIYKNLSRKALQKYQDIF